MKKKYTLTLLIILSILILSGCTANETGNSLHAFTERMNNFNENYSLSENGYIFNDSKLVYIADCLEIKEESLQMIKENSDLLIMPLTILKSQWAKPYHMGLEKLLEYVNIIKPKKTIINHMAVECDYDVVNSLTPENAFPAYDNLVVEF